MLNEAAQDRSVQANFPKSDLMPSALDTVGPGSRGRQTQPEIRNTNDTWVGRQLDRYIVEKWLGGGGMGDVYLARHRWLDIRVAIKVLKPMLVGDLEAVERFRREARLAAGLDHPNIVRATDGGPIQDSFYLVTEYLDGIDLAKLVGDHGPLQPQYASWIVSEVAQALQHAHEQDLIHRDIKPSNIMLLRDGSVKLLDLGLARNVNSSSQMTATGQFVGTVDYVSPEQAIDTRGVDHRADIYSLGCTLYFLVTGQAPFDGEAYDSIASKILAHTDEAPLAAETICKGAPKLLLRTIDQMMSKAPGDRIQSAAQVSKVLAPLAVPFPRGHVSGSNGELSQRADSPAHQSQHDVCDKMAKVATLALWYIGRTALSMTGIIERVEITNASRLGGKKRYKWEISPKGIAVFTVAVLSLLYVFNYIIIFEA